MQYIDALTNTFNWVKNLFLYEGQDPQQKIKVSDLFEPISSNLSVLPPRIDSAESWNSATQGMISDLYGMYSHTDRLDSYYETFNLQLASRLSKAKRSFQQSYSEFLTIKSIQDLGGTSVTLKGGLLDNIDTEPSLYKTYDIMNLLPAEGVFKLKDTGVFSAIRSKGGSLASFMVEHTTLSIMEEEGDYHNVTDGLTRTYWMGKSWSNSHIINNHPGITWTPSNHKEGLAIMGTLKLERPIVLSELTLYPALETPAIISRISWTPFNMLDFISQNFNSGSGWATSDPTWSITGSSVTFSASEGIDGGNAVKFTTQTNFRQQYITKIFRVSDAFAASTVNVTGEVGSGDLDDHRLEIAYNIKGTGIPGQALVEWLDTTGNVISQDIFRSYSSEIYTTYSFSSYRPENAVSGRVSLGVIEEPYDSGEIFMDFIQGWMGEKIWDPGYTIFKDTTLTLPSRVMATRVSVVVNQKNPIREVRDQDSLRYSIGFREIDVLYREYIPRGAVVSKTFKPRKEIRKFWLNTELENSSTNGLSFIVYPYSDDLSYQVQAAPYVVFSKGLDTNTTVSAGETFEIYTTEEWENNFITSNSSTNLVILDPITKHDIFDGTTRDAKVLLTSPIHFRRHPFKIVTDFLESYGLEQDYDPNVQTVYGISSGATGVLDDLLLGNTSALSVLASSLTTIPGYIPIKVTVETDRFKAYPDLSGKPGDQIVRTQTLELLQPTIVSTETTSTNKDPIGFDEWISRTTLADLLAYGLLKPANPRLGGPWPFSLIGVPFKLPGTSSIAAGDAMQTTIQACINIAPRFAEMAQIRSWYNRLYADNKLPASSSTTITTTETNDSQDAYKTKFAPIITGPDGTAFILYENDQTTVISPSSYSINARTGVVILNTPATGIYATYSYVVDPKNKASTESLDDLSNPEYSGFITRNMTNYTTGETPELRTFQPDKTRSDYYPVIEYYVNPNSEVILSREFFKFGDQPAKITVDYESLNIQPKFGVYAVRITSPTQSPIIKSLSFQFKEAGATI